MNQLSPRVICWVALIVAVIAGALMLGQWTVYSALPAETTGPRLLAIGRLLGMVATFGALMQLILMSRLPGLERALSIERLVTIHRFNGYTIFYALLFHPIFIVLGYQVNGEPGLLQQFIEFILHYPDVWRAWIGQILLLSVVAVSIVIVRRRLKYEYWYFTHLMVYLGILLAFGHQLQIGGDFVGHQWFIIYWYVLYIAAFATIGWFRFARPVLRLRRHGFKVEKVVPEARGIYSVYVRGHNIDKLTAKPGQFLIWRFLDEERWWQAHPFSMSMAPKPDQLRLTFKNVGDFTSRLHLLKPGTPVLIDGPRGGFTLDKAEGNKLLFLAGGIGITPLRAMMEALPEGSNAVFVYACRNEGERALAAELEELSKAKNLRVEYVYTDTTGRLTPELLHKLVPDIEQREVFLCGPPPMMNAMTEIMVGLGVDPVRIYSERFAFLGK